MELIGPVALAVNAGAIPMVVFGVVLTGMASAASVAMWRGKRDGWWENAEWWMWGRGGMRRALRRMQISLMMFAPIILLIAVAMAFVPNPREGTAGEWYVVAVVLLALVNCLVLVGTVLFGRPRFVIPPAHRGPGVVQELWRWLRDRHSGGGGNSQA